MRTIKFILLFFVTLSLTAEQPKNILFVGNSYLYYNNSVHNYVELMLREHYGTDIETKLSAIGGSRLHHHNIDHLLDFNNLNLDQHARAVHAHLKQQHHQQNIPQQHDETQKHDD